MSAPYSALSIQRHIRALTMVGSAHGRMTIVRSSHRPRSGWSISSARAKPERSSSAVETTVKYRARPTAAQKPGARQLIDVVAQTDERLVARARRGRCRTGSSSAALANGTTTTSRMTRAAGAMNAAATQRLGPRQLVRRRERRTSGACRPGPVIVRAGPAGTVLLLEIGQLRRDAVERLPRGSSCPARASWIATWSAFESLCSTGRPAVPRGQRTASWLPRVGRVGPSSRPGCRTMPSTSGSVSSRTSPASSGWPARARSRAPRQGASCSGVTAMLMPAVDPGVATLALTGRWRRPRSGRRPSSLAGSFMTA